MKGVVLTPSHRKAPCDLSLSFPPHVSAPAQAGDITGGREPVPSRAGRLAEEATVRLPSMNTALGTCDPQALSLLGTVLVFKQKVPRSQNLSVPSNLGWLAIDVKKWPGKGLSLDGVVRTKLGGGHWDSVCRQQDLPLREAK